jgi:site-specific DNA-methyltransferase (adenine-specific)
VVELNKILHADCMAIMRDIPDKYFELAIVDPPYMDKFITEGCASNKGLKGNYQTKCLNNSTPDKKYFDELFRISKNRIIWGVNYYSCYDLSGGRIVWDKDNTGNYSDCELAYCSFGYVIRKFKYRWNGMLQENMKQKERRIHPTQKPVALYRWLLQNYAKPRDKIIDTHSGSGSCAIACHLEKFDFLAIEKDEDYYKASLKRYNEEVSQGKLF